MKRGLSFLYVNPIIEKVTLLTPAYQPEAPAIAPSGFGLSLISIVRSLIWNDEMLQKGYDEVLSYDYWGSINSLCSRSDIAQKWALPYAL
jgi:hypothetical protein